MNFESRGSVAAARASPKMLNMLSTSLSMLSGRSLCCRRGVRTFSRSYQARPPLRSTMMVVLGSRTGVVVELGQKQLGKQGAFLRLLGVALWGSRAADCTKTVKLVPYSPSLCTLSHV